MIFLNALLPNLALIAMNGVLNEKLALVCFVGGVLSAVLPIVFGCLALVI